MSVVSHSIATDKHTVHTYTRVSALSVSLSLSLSVCLSLSLAHSLSPSPFVFHTGKSISLVVSFQERERGKEPNGLVSVTLFQQFICWSCSGGLSNH